MACTYPSSSSSSTKKKTIVFTVADGYDEKHIQLPHRATDGSVGFDLCVYGGTETFEIPALKSAIVCTGLSPIFDNDMYAEIHPRSSFAAKNQIGIGGGIIDTDYTGEIKVIVFNHHPTEAFKIEPGMKIAQFIPRMSIPTHTPATLVNRTDFEAFNSQHSHSQEQEKSKTRGSGGFGSTGKFPIMFKPIPDHE